MPNQARKLYPGRPASAIVGRSGSIAVRLGEATANALRRPDFRCGTDENKLTNMSETSPANRPFSAGALPL
jgi:hypothetical protein